MKRDPRMATIPPVGIGHARSLQGEPTRSPIGLMESSTAAVASATPLGGVVPCTSPNWNEVKLGDLVSVKHGFAFPGESFSDFETDNILITPGNFSIGGGFKLDKPKFHKGNIPADYIFSPGDLVVTMTDLSKAADTLGYGARIPYVEGKRLLHNQRVGKVILKPGAKTTLEFLHWVLRTTEYRNEMIATASGSTVKHTAPSRIEAFKFRLPPLPIQKAIAHVLGTLDDRIELCRRMNETLEAMARALFKDWFIDFGPVRAKMEGREPPGLSPEIAALFPDNLVDSELGEIPEGWNVTRFQDIIELNPSESLKKGVVAPYLDMAALPTTGSCADSAVPREFGSGMKFRNGDTLMARITPCLENGKTAFVQHLPIGKVAWGSTEFVVMRPKHPVPAPFVYLMARDESFRECAIRSMTGTSGRQRAQASSLADYKFVNPQRPVWEAFGAATSVSFEKIKSNATRIEALVQTRDALLPKLLSGELTIPEAMLQVAAA